MSPVFVGLVLVFVIVAAIIVARLKMKRKQLPVKKEDSSEQKILQDVKNISEEVDSLSVEKIVKQKIQQELSDTEDKEDSVKLGTAESKLEKYKKEEVENTGVILDDKAEDKAVAELEKEKRERRLKRLRQGLAPTRGGLINKIGAIFKTKKKISPQIVEELEEILLTSDVGAATARKLLNIVQTALEKNELSDPDAVWNLLKETVRQILSIENEGLNITSSKPFVIMVVGVNGVGKTTTIGKLATKFAEQKKKIVLAAGDTFRAAAVNQLTIWGRRAEAEVVTSKEGADPSSVVYDAIRKAKEIDADVVIADTAGRLHTQQPLMEELKKIHRVMDKAHSGAPHEVLLVLDATTGQNAIQQAAMFKETLCVTGLVLTKLDGTAKGGVIIGISHEHGIPVKFIGIGESKDDLREFDVDDFVEALFVKENTI